MSNDRVSRTRPWRWLALAVFCSVVAGMARSAEPTAQPLLWRIEGEPPSYLFGTIHLPDARVLALPAVVQRAFDDADAVFTEIPLDAATQAGIAGKIVLPADEDLKTLAGEELFSRLVQAFAAGLGGSQLPPAALEAIGAQLTRLKPWGATMQLALIDYLPDVAAGRQPLDVVLYTAATEKGKQLGGLETVDEQIACFDTLTLPEQVRLLRTSLDELDEARAQGGSPAKRIVEAYLSGDTAAILAEMNRNMERERELKTKLLSRLITERNHTLTDRILAKRAANAGKSCFFAIGALHLAGADGIPALLAKRGLRTTRVAAVAAPSPPVPAPASK